MRRERYCVIAYSLSSITSYAYCCPFVIESRLNDLNYIVNTPTTRRKRQICQLTPQGFSEEYKLTVDASDVGFGAELQFFLKTLTKISKNNPQLKTNELPYCYL